ncbi:3 beta-hydroxysteroid dehydrogenase/Delta 5--_4-isomerase [Fundidesulfovibrio magnetotacticus]|uniref:3 beta-hydroxysteroid dehydrogenase/Delta 5-->4-isomerase n=1 Tax=Fundidesulfovibrio magnetotacticus TaxID=2730080 RepID=A0A6V8LUL9_9BACT|nr:SDR family oxidoreductase [Fundidesulfovibrio magnetotacticus]GFK93809.1 3 beta-hydroxysteroid dehydrogenase/Delta 5-->4-isomerase [Fundidesulfovibrio magnetotacticus]
MLHPDDPVLVTGATGYVGGRLVPLLLVRGRRVRPAARSLDKLACRPWAAHPRCEPVQADMLDAASLDKALLGCRAAYYLVHSMGSAGRDFAQADERSALNFGEACARAGVERIVYLGGLGDDNAELSHHLRSRHRTAHNLARAGVPVTHLRAAAILGAGSASYEILRSLVERLPVMITPRWVHTRCQPISVRDVLDYLAACLEHPETAGQTYDIGGPDVLTYEDLFQLYAQVAGLPRRIIVPVPLLTPRLSAHWVRFVTPVPASVARPLIEGLRNEVVCRDDRIRRIIPLDLQGCRETFQAARRELKDRLVPTCWSDAGQVRAPEWLVCGDAPYAGGEVLEMAFRALLDAPPERVWPAVESIGGERGWYFADVLWKLRGLVDRLMGGVGLAPGRRDPERLFAGDCLDCWRVHACEPPARLVLLAAMKSPGEAALEITLAPRAQGRAELLLRARFQPRGLAGQIYWWALWLPHLALFRGLLRGLARAAGARVLEGPSLAPPANGQGCAVRR